MAEFANEYDMESYVLQFEGMPNLTRAARTLQNLAEWANDNSDGWAYWGKPRLAATQLMVTLRYASTEYYRGMNLPDASEAALRKMYSPIKSFLTKQGVDHAEILA